MNIGDYDRIKNKIRKLTGFDLEKYGSNQMMRRLDGYIARAKATSIVDFCKLLEHDNDERVKFKDFLTINVSEFFRDPEYFKTLQDQILPDLLRKNGTLNIWSAGCSSGAEIYSIAIILEKLAPFNTHKMLATDIDQRILSMAAAGGPYRAQDVRNVPESSLAKYFTFVDDHYWLKDRIKKKVTFKPHDLLNGVFGKDYDLIICRNVVIYFTDEAKKTLKRNFFNALKPEGILFIGATETMLDAAAIGFQRVSPCMFRKPAGTIEKGRKTPITMKNQ